MARQKKTNNAAPKAGKKKLTKAEQTAAHVASDDVERVRVTKDVPQIADAATASRQAHELARTTLQIEKIEADLREAATKARKEMKPLKKERARLAASVENNTVMRRMNVVEIRDYKLNQLRYEDADGKPVPGLEPVVMPAEMRQKTLFGEGGTGEGPRVAAEEDDDEDDLDLDDDLHDFDEDGPLGDEAH